MKTKRPMATQIRTTDERIIQAEMNVKNAKRMLAWLRKDGPTWAQIEQDAASLRELERRCAAAGEVA